MVKFHETVADYELSLLRLISDPPKSPGQYGAYLDMIGKGLVPFKKLQGEHLGAGVRALSAAAVNIIDPSLFRAVTRMLIVNHDLPLSARIDGQDRPLHEAIKASNLTAVRVFLELAAHSKQANTSALLGNDPVDGTLLLACHMIRKRSGNSVEILKAILNFICSHDFPEQAALQSIPCVNVICEDLLETGNSDDAHEAVSALLNAGFSAIIKNEKTNDFPLHQASAQGHWKTVAALLRHGANVEAIDATGATAFDRAISLGKTSHELRAVMRSAQMNKIIFKK